MQITTIEQLKEVKTNDTLFLINPFGCRDQSKVSIEAFTVQKLNEGVFTGRKQFFVLDIDYVSDNHLGDMIGRCKYVYTSLSEANEKLNEIHKGIHSAEVKEHADFCDEAFASFNYA